MSFFQGLVLILVLFFVAAIVLMPTYIKLTKETFFAEFKKLWEKEVEAKKRELAMKEVNIERAQTAKVGRKQKMI